MPDLPPVHLIESLTGRTVTGVERCDPWFVARVHLHGAPSVAVKWLRENAVGFRTDHSQMLTERAALTFVETLGSGLAPTLVGADDATTVLVIEDLAPRVPLYDVLRSGDREAGCAGLEAFAATVGRMHASSVGRAGELAAIRAALDAREPAAQSLAGDRGTRARMWTETCDALASWDVPVADRVHRDMGEALALLADPGPFLVLSNGDAGANNFMVDGADGRIIDFEFAGFRHALGDAASFHVPDPMWLSVGDPHADGTESIYRVALCEAVPQAADDAAFGAAMTAACLVKAIGRLHRVGMLDGRPTGEPSRPQMVATMEAAARAGDTHGGFPHLTGWARSIAELLRRRWPDADLDLPPVYRARHD